MDEGIPQVLLCAACTAWAAAKGWAPFNILMCWKPEHGQDCPKPADARKFFKKYLGKLNTSIVDTSIRIPYVRNLILLVLVLQPLTLSSELKLIHPL